MDDFSKAGYTMLMMPYTIASGRCMFYNFNPGMRKAYDGRRMQSFFICRNDLRFTAVGAASCKCFAEKNKYGYEQQGFFHLLRKYRLKEEVITLVEIDNRLLC